MTARQRFARLVTDVVVRAPALWPLFRRPLTRMFDAIAPQWDVMKSAERLTAFEAALEAIPERPQKALDVGTGTGDAALVLAERWPGADVLGLDLSEEMVAEARRKIPGELEGRLRFDVADARRLPVPDASFDLVALNNMIPFFDELARVSAPGGHLVLAFSRGPQTPIFVAPARIRRELARRGFELVREVAAGPGTAVVARFAGGV